MNPNRQNTCFTGRPGGRPPMPVPGPAPVPVNAVPCCSDVVVTPMTPCCGDVTVGGVIIGGADPGCYKETVLGGMPIAMAYVPWQNYGNLYSQQQALHNGTLFRELDLDFAGRRCN